MHAGLDIGTTGCKIVVFSDSGEELFCSYRSYIKIHKDGRDEIDSDSFVDAIKQVTKETFTKYPDIHGLGVDSFGESFLLLDENDKPLSNIIISSDSRGSDELNGLLKIIDERTIKEIIGAKPNISFSLAKLLWFKNNEPDIFAKTSKVLLIEDAVIYLLTGNNYIDYSLAARSMMFDVQNLTWSDTILEAANIDKNILSIPVELGHDCGEIKKELQDELGIKTNAKIICAGHDQVAVAIGSGVLDKELATDGAGTVECISPIFENLENKSLLIDNNYAIVPFIDKKYITYAYTFTSGALIDWYIKSILKSEDKNIFKELEDGFVDGPIDLLCLPYFSGSATPYMDPDVKGAFVGLSLASSQEIMYQAILQGISFDMKLNLAHLKDAGVVVKHLYASGGGSKSDKWMQIRADIYGIKINRIKGKECGARGGAMLSISNKTKLPLSSITNDFIKIESTFYPRKDKHDEYIKIYNKYLKLYKYSKEVLKDE